MNYKHKAYGTRTRNSRNQKFFPKTSRMGQENQGSQGWATWKNAQTRKMWFWISIVMKEIVYSFYNTLGDKFYLRLLCEGDMYREIHIDVVDKIKKDIHFGFDK